MFFINRISWIEKPRNMKAASIVNEAYFVEQWKRLRKQLKPIGCVVLIANLLHWFCRIYGKSWQNMEQYSGQGGAKSTTRTFSFRLGGLTYGKISPKPDFTGLRTGLLCSFKFYRTAILRTCPWVVWHSTIGNDHFSNGSVMDNLYQLCYVPRLIGL